MKGTFKERGTAPRGTNDTLPPPRNRRITSLNNFNGKYMIILTIQERKP